MSQAHALFATLHVCCTGTVSIAIDNEMHLFCSLSVSFYVVINNSLPFVEYVGMSRGPTRFQISYTVH